MKKRFLLTILVITLSVVFIACSNKKLSQQNDEAFSTATHSINTLFHDKRTDSSTKLTIVNNEGKTESLTWDELKSIGRENGAKYDKYYVGANVTAVGEVKSISANIVDSPFIYDRIELADGARITILHDSCDFVADLSKGDIIKITSNIGGTGYFPDIKGTYENGTFNKETLASTIIEIVE